MLSRCDSPSLAKIKSVQRALRLDTVAEAFGRFVDDNREETAEIVSGSLTLLCDKTLLTEAMVKLKGLLQMYPVRSGGACMYKHLPTLIKMQYDDIFDRYTRLRQIDVEDTLNLPEGVSVKAAVTLNISRFHVEMIDEAVLRVEKAQPLLARGSREEKFLIDLEIYTMVRVTPEVFAILPKFRAFAVLVDLEIRLFEGIYDDYIVVHRIKPNQWVSLKMHANSKGDGFYVVVRIHNGTFIYISINRDIIPINLDGHIISDRDFTHPDRVYLSRQHDYMVLDSRICDKFPERSWCHSLSCYDETLCLGVAGDTFKFDLARIWKMPNRLELADQMFFSHDLVIFNSTCIIILNNRDWHMSMIREALISRSTDTLPSSLFDLHAGGDIDFELKSIQSDLIGLFID